MERRSCLLRKCNAVDSVNLFGYVVNQFDYVVNLFDYVITESVM